jgi:hypothetical protein
VPVGEHREMQRTMPWPFPGDVFPPELGAVVQLTVLEGSLPALIVGHTEDGDWYVGDGLNDPNVRGACISTHLQHAIERNSSIATLAVVPPGHEAHRGGPGEPWSVEQVRLEP